MATRKEDAKERIKKAKEGRKNQITAIQTERENWGHPIGYVNRYTFTDQWTGRKPTDKMETAEPGSAERQATKDREEYLKRLDAHIERVFRADEVILASWEKISQEVQGLLIPPTPRDPPTHEVEYKEVLKPSSALRGYTKVAYRYSVTTVHGTSGQSPWTEDLPIDTNEKKKVPVLVFGSTAFIIGAEPTVNIERRVSNPKEGSGVPAGPIVAAAGVLKRVVSEIHWSDEEHLPHGRG
ncbi:hypothetical protein FRC14_004300 [Serendipita sp. 396]|nr:hypothetical protein FRC14_004300 [Serendipita sp. 396]KAG8780033.1 hypothetical protein FRC15_009793 [Serendipita sp. 397]KAG8866892.1 hypothetical protein FRC20_007229 [Serendipita sp. 405]